MQHPALGLGGECFSGAFLLMQKQFLETVFYFTRVPVPEFVFRCFSFPSPTARQLLQGLGGTSSRCESASSVTIAVQSSWTSRC